MVDDRTLRLATNPQRPKRSPGERFVDFEFFFDREKGGCRSRQDERGSSHRTPLG
jgi:hypothetical protein